MGSAPAVADPSPGTHNLHPAAAGPGQTGGSAPADVDTSALHAQPLPYSSRAGSDRGLSPCKCRHPMLHAQPLPCTSQAGPDRELSPCRCRPPHAVCTAYTPRSSTSEPGTGRAGSPPDSVCCGHAHSRCSHSSSPGGTCDRRSPERNGWPGRSWASHPGARALVCGAVGRRHLSLPPGPEAERWRRLRPWPRWWCCPP